MPLDLEKLKVNSFSNEEQFQAAAIKMLSYEFPKLRNKFFHCMNEYYIPKNTGESNEDYKKRCMVYGNMNKAKGKLAGVPDILIVHNGILFKIELKQPNGVLGEDQEKIHEVWNRDCFGIAPVQVCYNLYHVYMYVKWIINSDLRIDTSFGFKPFQLQN